MKELLENIKEFLDSGEDNLKKGRFNAANSDFFKAIVVECDYLLYQKMKVLPKNHSDRFSLLSRYFPDIYRKVSELFNIYTKSYNLKIKKEEALKVKEYAYGLKNISIKE